jgi:hypothetical protein
MPPPPSSVVEEADGRVLGARRQVHVAHRRRQVRVTRQFPESPWPARPAWRGASRTSAAGRGHRPSPAALPCTAPAPSRSGRPSGSARSEPWRRRTAPKVLACAGAPGGLRRASPHRHPATAPALRHGDVALPLAALDVDGASFEVEIAPLQAENSPRRSDQAACRRVVILGRSAAWQRRAPCATSTTLTALSTASSARRRSAAGVRRRSGPLPPCRRPARARRPLHDRLPMQAPLRRVPVQELLRRPRRV